MGRVGGAYSPGRGLVGLRWVQSLEEGWAMPGEGVQPSTGLGLGGWSLRGRVERAKGRGYWLEPGVKFREGRIYGMGWVLHWWAGESNLLLWMGPDLWAGTDSRLL